MTRNPTIYEVLRAKLGREPNHNEIVAECKRILREGWERTATERSIE